MAKVKVYSTPTCPWCHRAMEFLKENDVEFEEINVAEDQKAAEEMVSKSQEHQQEVRISLKGINPGIYFIQSGNESKTTKLVITK